MDGFEQMCKDAGVDDIDRLLVEPFYIEGFRQGLRRAAEIAWDINGDGQRDDATRDACEIVARRIEREASKLEWEGV